MVGRSILVGWWSFGQRTIWLKRGAMSFQYDADDFPFQDDDAEIVPMISKSVLAQQKSIVRTKHLADDLGILVQVAKIKKVEAESAATTAKIAMQWAVRALHKAGYSYKDIGNLLDVSDTYAHRISK